MVVSIAFHVLCHLFMCLITLTPVKDITLWEKKEHERNRYGSYFGEVYLNKNNVTFLQAFLVGLAPSYLSFWVCIALLNFLIHNQMNVGYLILCCFFIITLFLSATPSSTDLKIISDAFQNDSSHSWYQILLLLLSFLTTWKLVNIYSLQFPHEIFFYLLITLFYFIFKFGFKITGHILSSITTNNLNSPRKYTVKSKNVTPLKYKPAKRPRRTHFNRNEKILQKERKRIRKARKKLMTGTNIKIKDTSTEKSTSIRVKSRKTPKIIQEKEGNENKPKINEIKAKKEKFRVIGKKVSMPENSELFEEFLLYTHENESIKEVVDEFNKSGCWIKILCPTQTFIDFLKSVKKFYETLSHTNKSTFVKDKIKLFSHYLILTMNIREKDALNKTIKNLILKNKGKFNAYDIQKWLFISDTSARNQLKKIFTESEYQDYIRTQKHVTIDTIIKIAKKKGGKCHTTDLKNAKSKIHLECAEGHHFYTRYDSVVYHNTWRPHCYLYVSETVCRRFFEKIFKRPFPKSYPKWLVNENGNQMELDGYNKDLGLAFEYQGIQHRNIAFGKTGEELKKIQEEDLYKLKQCKENGVTLIQIPDDEIVPYHKMQEYIIKEYEKKKDITLKNVPKYDYKEFIVHENKHAKKFRDYVEKKGGALVTPYFTAKKKVTIMCERGHQWTTTPDSVYKNNWCSKCAGNEKGTTEYFQKIGGIFNCELVNEYVNAKTPLWYKCQKGHKFKRLPYWLKRDYKNIDVFCPECKMDKYAKKFQNFVHKKGWSLLTPYRGRFKTITIKCKNEHVWNTTPAAVYQGNRCKECKNKN